MEPAPRQPGTKAAGSWQWARTAGTQRALLDAARAVFVEQGFADASIAEVAGALVQPHRPGGIELLVGIVADPVWGQVLAVGLGGVWVEILRDTAVLVLPADRDQIRQALRSLRGAELFDGPRGTEKADLDAVADAIAAAAALAGRLGDRLEALEINPLLVRGSQVEALDTLITWRKIESNSLSRTDPALRLSSP